MRFDSRAPEKRNDSSTQIYVYAIGGAALLAFLVIGLGITIKAMILFIIAHWIIVGSVVVGFLILRYFFKRTKKVSHRQPIQELDAYE